MMFATLRPVFVLSAVALGLAACDEVAAYDQDPYVRGENLANLKCARAVSEQTGIAGAVPNTTIPVFEANEYLINVPGQDKPWSCITDDAGIPQTLRQLT